MEGTLSALVGMCVPPGDAARVRAEPFSLSVGCLDDRLPAPLADVWNGSGILTGGMAAEVGFHAVDRQIQSSGDFLIPQPFLTEFMDSELFGFCHNKPLSERHKALLTLRPRKRVNMRMTKK